jgi:hypothetical protein
MTRDRPCGGPWDWGGDDRIEEREPSVSSRDQEPRDRPAERRAVSIPKPPAPIYIGRKIAPGTAGESLRSEFTYSVIAPVATAKPIGDKPIGDKRRTGRARTHLRGGHLSDRRDVVITECLIADRSRTGARLRLALDRPLPKSFVLWDDVGRVRMRAELAWQKGRDAGVRLVGIMAEP